MHRAGTAVARAGTVKTVCLVRVAVVVPVVGREAAQLAAADAAMAIEAMKLGAYEYLLKPLELAQLREVIDRCRHRRRLWAR